MDKDKEYYQNWLKSIEYQQLEAVGDILKIEMAIYEARKIIRQALEMNEYNNPVFDKVKLMLIELKNKQKRLSHEIDNFDLDISHARFIIELLNRPTDEDS